MGFFTPIMVHNGSSPRQHQSFFIFFTLIPILFVEFFSEFLKIKMLFMWGVLFGFLEDKKNINKPIVLDQTK